MDDASPVGGGERVADGHRELEEDVDGQTARGDEVREHLARNELHGEEVRSAAVFFHREDLDDVGVVEGG